MTRVLSSHFKQGLTAVDEPIAPPRQSYDGARKNFSVPQEEDEPAAEEPAADAPPAADEPSPAELAAFSDPVRLLIERAAQAVEAEEEEQLQELALPEETEGAAQDSAPDMASSLAEMAGEQPAAEMDAMVQMIDADVEQNAKRHAGEGWYWAVVSRGGESAYHAALRHRSRARARARRDREADDAG
ncbi:hypothetical protein [Pseudoduganella rhizocola]|uniref:hypothetical protein n=1 Tax=Pseudoduganella rhizocola TaxID=3382643 RepID=UPI0038B43087